MDPAPGHFPARGDPQLGNSHMVHLSLLQIQTMGLLDPIAILFFVGAAVALWGVWVVIRRPLSLDDEKPLEAEKPKSPGTKNPAR